MPGGIRHLLNACWYNTVLVFDGESEKPFAMHHKVELSRLDRRHFAAGSNARVYEIAGVRFGVQACRELLFPQTWSALKSKEANIMFHINNAVQKRDALWEHVLISRAIENSMFVCSVNNASPPQELKSYLVSPKGEIVLMAERQKDNAITAEIDLGSAIADLSKREDY